MRTIVTLDDDEIVVPPHPEGGIFLHVLLFGADQAAFADYAGELIDVILPGYGDLADTGEGDDDALIQRARHLALVANAVQSDFNIQAIERQLVDMDSADENVLTALVHDRSEPWSGIYADDPEDDSVSYHWDNPVPLVLVATDYAPYVPERPTPTGSVRLLDPIDEITYLKALTDLGLVNYMSQK